MANSKFFESKLHRLVGQIRYRPTILTFDNTATLAAGQENDFEEWLAPKHDDVSLFSPSVKKFLKITSDSVTYLNEGDEDTDKLFESIRKIFEKSVKDMSVRQIRRVGLRYTQVLETHFKFEELSDLIFKKFYMQNDSLKKISAEKVRDTVFILDGLKNGYLNHVQIGPVNRQQALQYYNASFEDNSIQLKDSNLFVDVDVFINDGLTKDNTLPKLQGAIEETRRITNEYLDYLAV